ncbi:MAG: cell division/cell wall cluster transcriptional repressor MraZ [Dehalococcoidia bacterium]|nr:cell division/cell wall cluster transcriptional repressor MraZ [Dehalococcoidia bacterium]
MYFYGTFEHSIDERGRLAIPARYRSAFVGGGVLRESPEGCLEVYTQDTFDEEVQRRLAADDGNRHLNGRRIRRSFLPGAFAAELDKQGRVLVPQQLRTAGDLEGRVLVVGCGDYLELWRPERWEQEQERLAAEEAAGDAAEVAS